MPRYNVTLCEERFYFTTVIVEAGNEREAHAEALVQGVKKPAPLWRRDGGRGINIINTERK